MPTLRSETTQPGANGITAQEPNASTKLMADHPTFGRIDYVAPAATFDVGSLGAKGDLGSADFVSPVADPYLSNPIARASVTMAELSALRTAPAAMAAE